MHRSIRLLSAALIIFTMLSGSFGTTLPAAEAAAWQDKIDPWVLSTAENGETEFLVMLADQADLSRAAALESKTAKGDFVYRQLTAIAEASQIPVQKWLDSAGADYQSYWVVNALWVRGNLNLIQQIAQRPDVAHIYANPRVQLSLPETPENTTLNPEGIEWNITKINADDVWAAGYTGQGVVIAGADTGYEWSHPALINHYRGWNGASANHNYNWHDATGLSPNTPVDPYGHGTHTMGTMVGDDGAGNQVGVAPGAQWIGCRNMDSGGYGTPARYIECYEWFIAPYPIGGNPLTDGDPSLAPDVINNSWGCPASEGCTDPNILLSTVQAVRAAGILTAHSAGNEGSSCSTVGTPAAIYAESFSVGAVSSTDTIASFSSRGPVTVDGSNRLKPNISAPGVSIRSSVPGGGYSLSSGTSMAAPHIAGVVALLISANPALAGDVDTIETLIEQTAVPLYTTQGCGGDTPSSLPNNVFGWGRVDAWAAYQEIPYFSLAISKTAPETVWAGDILTYTLTVTNSHPFSATHQVFLSDTIPAQTAFLRATGNYTITGKLVTWSLGDLAAAASEQVELVIRVPVTATGSITNAQYGAHSAETAPVSGTPVITLVQIPVLGVRMSGGFSSLLYNPCREAEIVLYTHEITNTSSTPDTFLLTVSSSAGWANLTSSSVSLAAGESSSFDIEITPPCPLPEGSVELTEVTATSTQYPFITATVTDTTRIGFTGFIPLVLNEP